MEIGLKHLTATGMAHKNRGAGILTSAASADCKLKPVFIVTHAWREKTEENELLL